MYEPMPPAFHHEPLRVAQDTFLVRQLPGEGQAPVNVYINSLVIRGRQPVVVDTGGANDREQWLRDVFGLVDPKDVRWVFISHDDSDHTGNVAEVLDACPNATLVGSWFMWERMASAIKLPLHRMLWLNDGDSFDAGDRTFGVIRPPIYDSPTTRGLFDSKTGVYWASDAFGTVVPGPADHVGDLDPGFWQEAFGTFQIMGSPWLEIVDPAQFATTVRRIEDLGVATLATAHGPLISGPYVQKAFAMARAAAGQAAAPHFGDEVRQAMVEAILQVHGEAAA